MAFTSCHFRTERLSIFDWHAASASGRKLVDLPRFVSELMTPSVTRSLPEHWQGDYSLERAAAWIEERDREGTTLLATRRRSGAPVGLVILFFVDADAGPTVRLGYLLAEEAWGQGLATELIKGVVAWCRDAGVANIVAGVERGNAASRGVLKKSGFGVANDDNDADELFYEIHFPSRAD